MGKITDLLFGKKTDLPPPGAGVGYGDFPDEPHGHYPILAANAKGNGPDGWAPRVGIELAPVRNQDELLIHFDTEPPGNPQDNNGTPYYTTRNRSYLVRGNVEHLESGGVNGLDSWVASDPDRALQATARRDPKETPPLPSRPTAYMSPSNYRFTYGEQGMRGGRGDTPYLNGIHFSMASNRRVYPIAGMRPVVPFRNTFRTEPPPRDAEMRDIPANGGTVTAGEYTSPVAIRTAVRSWRLT